jgi:hypothetical protein
VTRWHLFESHNRNGRLLAIEETKERWLEP